jgi:uncharacterized membrane-anchored protein
MRPPEHDDDGLDPEFAPPPDPPAPGPSDRAIAWAGGHARALLSLAVVFQVGVLLAMIGMAAKPLMASGSQTVLLNVMPVDPRDLFRGDYVTLAYDVSRLPSYHAPGQTVYVPLAVGPGGHASSGGPAVTSPPAAGPYLRGRVNGIGRVEFGLEKFFVPEGQGRDYERAVRERRLWAEVTVAPDGQAVLRRLVIE